MSDLQIFNFNSNKVRIQTIEGREYFCAKDVCDTLGYVNGKDAISRHCKKDGVVKYALIDSLNREQKYSFINESNLYRLIIHSKLPEAEKFEEWVFNEVLPQIRKTGQYGVPQQLSRLEILQIALENEQKVIALENENTIQKEYIEEFIEVAHNKSYSKVAKEDLHMSPYTFIKQLKQAKYICKDRVPMQRYITQGLFKIKDTRNGYKRYLMTPKGIEYFKRKMVTAFHGNVLVMSR